MDVFVWDATYEVGHARIDHEHQGLVDLINQVLQLQGDPDAALHLPRLLGALLRYAGEHFFAEEELMVSQGLDERHINTHREAHRAFTREVLRIRQLTVQSDQLQQLGEFLTGWLVGHILSYDRSLMRQLHRMESGQSAAAAYEAELAEPDDPAARNLLRAMSALLPFGRAADGDLGALRDAVERIAREQVATQTALCQIIEGTPVPTFVLDREHRVSHWNLACARLTGVPAQEMVGTTEPWRGFYATARPVLANIIMSNDGGGDGALAPLYPDGHWRSPLIEGAVEAEIYFTHMGEGGRWLHCIAAPLRDSRGRLIGAVETLQDVTDRRQARQALLDSQARLEQDVAARTEELVRRNSELIRLNETLVQTRQQLVQSEKLASIGQLAAGVAHEINNPIGYVQSNLGSLDKYLADMFRLLDAYEAAESSVADPVQAARLKALREEIELHYLRDDLPDLMRECKEGVTRVKKIVQDLKDFSRVDNRQEFELADIHQGLDSTLTIVANEIKYKADVVKRYGELPQVECLASQLNQVFMNLLVNAAQAMGDTRGTITVSTGTDGETVWMEVADNGCGIPADQLDRIFDPFYTTKPVGKGTGLGLALSYGIVQNHHGSLTVCSEPGVGTTFRITLPVRQQAKASTA